MAHILHKADTRGHANHGWLDSHHTFSFASYYNPERVHFGALRVLNDDIIDGGTGFDTHPHQNMEIVSIPISGALKHKDSMGSEFIIKDTDVQMMSAGTGVFHSEYNASETEKANFLQIWVIPKEDDITPKYDQQTLDFSKCNNTFMTIITPDGRDNTMQINQDAFFSLGKFDQDTSTTYDIHMDGNVAYLFIIDGQATVGDTTLEKRDGLGITDDTSIEITFQQNTYALLIEVPRF